MLCLIPTNPISTGFFSSCTGFLLNTGSTLRLASITFNSLHYSQPAYLHSILHFHTPANSLRSSNTYLLTILLLYCISYNLEFSTPVLCSCNCPDIFRQHLKTHYYQQAFSSPRHLPPCTPHSAFADGVHIYISITYLLTLIINSVLTTP